MNIFENFTLDGVSYYKHNQCFYADNMTIREKITLKEYRSAMTRKFIAG